MRELVGQQFGNYRLIRLLGYGGFAEVYLGQHVRLNALAAVKILHARLTEKESRSFYQEAQVIASLAHPHIVRVLDYATRDDVPFLVMDYAPNGSLRGQHPKGTRLPLSIIVAYVQQVAAALQYAHDKKLIHRDVKPENMLVGPAGEILLSDFGLATVAHTTASMSLHAPAGTLHYMAPEAIRKQARPASDQYALAIVVYEWLCGAYPFQGATPAQILTQHIKKPPPPLREKLPTISPQVEQVVLKALEKEPGQRFPSVQAFAQALDHASRAEPLPEFPRTPRRVSRRAALTTLTLTVTGIAAAGWLAWWSNTAHPLFTYRGHSDAVNSVGWSFNGKRIATGSSDRTVQVWNAGDGGNVLTYHGHRATVNVVGWSADNIHIASASDDKTVQVWQAQSGELVYTYRGHTGQVKAMAWSPDGRLIASGDENGTLQVWHALNGGNVFTTTGGMLAFAISSLAWSPDGERIAVCSGIDGKVQVLNALTGANMYTHQAQSTFESGVLAWSPDGKYIAIAATLVESGTVELVDAATGSHISVYQGQHDVFTQWSPATLAWAPDSRRIAAGLDSGAAEIWDAMSGNNVRSYNSKDNAVKAVAWSPGGTSIAAGCADGVVQLWGTG